MDVIRLGTGIFSAAIIPAAFAFATDRTSEEDRTRGVAQSSAAGGIGFVIGPAVGGLLGGITWRRSRGESQARLWQPGGEMRVAVTISPRDHDAVLFDLDGVLTRTASVHAAVWKKAADIGTHQDATRESP